MDTFDTISGHYRTCSVTKAPAVRKRSHIQLAPLRNVTVWFNFILFDKQVCAEIYVTRGTSVSSKCTRIVCIKALLEELTSQHSLDPLAALGRKPRGAGTGEKGLCPAPFLWYHRCHYSAFVSVWRNRTTRPIHVLGIAVRHLVQTVYESCRLADISRSCQ